MPRKSSPETFREGSWRQPLLAGLLAATRRYGAGQVIASDMTNTDMNYRQLWTRAFILDAKLQPLLPEQKFVGVLLPNSLGVLVIFVALHVLGRVPCMLNFSAGEANILHACRIACAKTVLTSRLFIEKGKFEHLIEALKKEHTIIYLEDFRKQVNLGDKLRGLFKAFFASVMLHERIRNTSPDEPAVVLYTSGSEGVPKGVALSHANILSNIAQVIARIPTLAPPNTVFNAMPVFHSFGLTVGMLMPPLRGLKTYLYPSPVHYKQIPPLVEESGATIMLGTDTFYNGYAKYAEPRHFARVWLAVAGAEKLKETTRQYWSEKLHVEILQGYGVTESSPVVSVNTPDEHKPGTVGKLFPGMAYKLEPVPGLDKGGRLFIKGPNIMLGYLKVDKPGIIQPQGEWYDTGDIVDVDADGFIVIQGRAKRFAKIAGEMVSLQAVEEIAAGALPEVCHAAIAVADERKGEQVVLFTESSTLSREQLVQYARTAGVGEIYLPRQVIFLETIPRLGNGKIDYVTLGRQVKA